MRKVAALIGLSLLLTSTPGLAQEAPDTASQPAHPLRAMLGYSEDLPLGTSDEAVQAVPAQATPSAPAEGNWIVRHPVLFGTLLGGGVGAVVAANVRRGEPAIVLGGAAVGGYGGLIGSAARKARRKEPVGHGTKLGIVVGAVGLALGTYLTILGTGGV